ncbi:PREDICTED: fanconi-associated nuclease 1-like [Priapulus caudatus]|uniref:Fanconi-associated nuclease n=1 Tax=Priapulus caudatus TaxID=37621 RepID=A0ABM1F1T2_PRICU|nr:PREDICTED: fanconi-associated nuclease 1-like [Priapulus caudatus]
MVMLGVEDLCIMRYRELGYTEGVHGEGLAFTSLLALLLWDVLYVDGVADAFRGPHQPHPLDLRSDDFYLNRRRGIDDRLLAVTAATGEELGDDAERCWRKHEGEACSLINWQLFDGVDHVRSLLLCMNGGTSSEDPRATSEGPPSLPGRMPDRCLWVGTPRRESLTK